MIKPAIYNPIDFSSLIKRSGNLYDPSLQRGYNIIGFYGEYLSFEYIPAVMPDAEPTATLTSYLRTSPGGTQTNTQEYTITLTDRYIFFFDVSKIGLVHGTWDFMLEIAGEIIFSEKCLCYIDDELADNNIIKVKAYNNDMTRGYLNSTYPACGFFQFTDLDSRKFGVDKVEFKYSYGRNKILRSENFIKRRLIFLNLTMYQQNLLKFLCNCQNLTLDGIAYQLIGDFSERNKNEESEICDLQAEFVTTDQTFFESASTEFSGDLKPVNLFL